MQELKGVPIWLKKLLLGPVVKLNSLRSFHISCLLIHLKHAFESEFASDIKDMSFVLS